MSFEVRPIETDELDDLLLADARGFGGTPLRHDASRSWAEGELDRTRVAFDAGRMVGVSRTYTFELTMPGGGMLPAAAVSWVSVLPTHRRRGVLTQMMNAMHDDARARNEPAAILTASESSIYGRFGYGVAAWRVGITAERARVAFARPSDDAGSVRFVTLDDARAALPPIYDRCRRARAGMTTRPDFWWPQVFWEFMVGRARGSFVVVHSDAQGNDDGYVVYAISGDDSNGLPDRKLGIIDMQGETPSAWTALWRYVFGVDLIGSVTAANLPLDDPLRHIVVDGRRVRIESINDHLWIAPLDSCAVLNARTYTVPGRIVVQTRAPDGTTTTVAVEAAAGANGIVTDCSLTTDAPDLACDSAVLGMCVLGGNRWSELAAAGRVDGSAESLALADAMFLATPAAALLSYF